MGHHPPPPPPELDPAATGGYGAYATHAASGYGVDENGHHVHHHLPPLSEALHPDDGSAATAGTASSDSLGHHAATAAAHYGASHPASAYDATGAVGSGHHGDPSSVAGHGHYEQQQQHSSNFFDSQIMEPPPPAAADGGGGASHHHHHHHASNHHSALHGGGAANGGYGGGQIMTPPPPASSHGGYSSSPYQSNASAPLFHRASISGPVMHSHYPPPPGTPSSTHGTDVWSSTPAAARPHTADGMFASQMGGLPGQWASMSEYNRGPRGSTSSMSDAAPTSGSSKVFSYMPSNGDDSSSTAGSQGHQTSGGPRKRPRRRYDEIERLYTCSWPGCQKSYGTLNHLNAHVAMQKHGPKRSPTEFKEMRKAWRKGKREDEQRRQANAAAANEEVLSRSKMVFAAPNQPFMTHSGYPVSSFGASAHVMPPPGPSPSAGAAQPGRYHTQHGGGMYGSGYSQMGGIDPNGRGSYAVGGGNQQGGGGGGGGAGSGGLGAYLMAHRGSI